MTGPVDSKEHGTIFPPKAVVNPTRLPPVLMYCHEWYGGIASDLDYRNPE